MDTFLITEAEQVLALLRRKHLTLCTAESCTGGLLSAYFTAVAGSSDVFERGLVTYSNAAKTELIGVDAQLIVNYGAVSEPVARAMALGALKYAPVSVAITGVAGPSGGSREKPVGTVHLAVASQDKVIHHHAVFGGDRHAIRQAACTQAMQMIAQLCG